MERDKTSDLIREAASRTLVPDDLFAEAYASVPAEQRALLKTCIARLWEWTGPAARRETAVEASWRQGFSSRLVSAPRKACAVFFNASVGPAALLAALVPARALGVPDIFAVFVDENGEGAESLSHSVLAALELAGQEETLCMDPEEAASFAAHFAGPGRCSVVLGGAGFKVPGPCWRGPIRKTVGIWLDEEPAISPDLDAIAFAHPEAEALIMGSAEALAGVDPSMLPDGYQFIPSEFSQFQETRFHGVFVPGGRVNACLSGQCLVLGPGQEGAWVYPGLSADHFITKRLAWFAPGGAEADGAI